MNLTVPPLSAGLRSQRTNVCRFDTFSRVFKISLTTLVLITGAVLALSTSGCTTSSSNPPVPHSPPPQPSSSTQTPADTARQGALTAYTSMWSDFAEAALTSDWQSPKLANNATGQALSALSRGLYADHYNGLVSRGKPVLHPEVSSMEPAEAPTKVLIVDCGDSTNWTKHRADTGEPADDSPNGRRHINAIVEKAVDSTWKVTEFGVHEVGTC